MTHTTEQVAAQVELFVAALIAFIKSENLRSGSAEDYYSIIRVATGAKNYKIIKCNAAGEDGSVFCFIEKSTGDIYKAASWKAPAKGVRGSIFDDNFSIGKGVNYYGAAYKY